MNLQSLSDPWWLLPVGVGLFWLMRGGGCGGAGHGHGSHSRSGQQEHPHDHGAASTQTDPVCGMQIDPQKAVGTRIVGGRTLSFCSSKCLEAFDKDPAAYTSRPNTDDSHQRHGCC